MGEPIKIIITQGGTGGEALGSTSTPKGRDTDFGKEGKDLKVGFTKKEMLAVSALVVASARKNIINSINNNLAMTGNYMETTRINDAIQVGTKVAGIGLAGAGIAKAVSAGLMSGPGAVIAVGAIVTSEAISISQKIRQFEIQVSKVNYQAERMRIRAGTSLANGSRGTND